MPPDKALYSTGAVVSWAPAGKRSRWVIVLFVAVVFLPCRERPRRRRSVRHVGGEVPFRIVATPVVDPGGPHSSPRPASIALPSIRSTVPSFVVLDLTQRSGSAAARSAVRCNRL